MSGEAHVCTCGDCCPIAYVDRCRFEQALRDPVDAQLDAALAELEQFTRLPYGVGNGRSVAVVPEPEATRRNRDFIRRVLLAAAVAVLEREPCSGCGRPKGTGTLLDFRPTPPRSSGEALGVPVFEVEGLPEHEWALLGGGGPSLPLEVWREFAARYRCPACAEASP